MRLPSSLGAAGRLGLAAALVAACWALLAVPLVPLVLGVTAIGHGRIGLVPLGQVLLGLAGVVLLCSLAAHPVARWSVRRLGLPAGRRSWGGAVAWLLWLLTAGGVLALLLALVVLLAGSFLLAPLLVTLGETVSVGPWRVQRVPVASGVAVAGVLLLVGVVRAAPWLWRWVCLAGRAVLVGPEQQLQAELDQTLDSRARLVDGFDAERRRIERDLHDGVQPQLLGVSLTLGLALAQMDAANPARPAVAQAQQQALDALAGLRDFVRGIHPQVLTDHGLVAALEELATTLPVPVRVVDRLDGRLPRHVESSLYFAAAELVTNAVKHAAAQQVTVTVSQPDGSAQVQVDDDGRGGADPAGGGLTGVRDRLSVLDARLDLDSPPGGPTRARVTVPLVRRAAGVGER